MALAGLPGKPIGSAHALFGPPPHDPLFGWHSENGHLKKCTHLILIKEVPDLLDEN
jgi:hypothetical protein